MKVYHGTSKVNEKNIVGPPSNIDVTNGGGEMGQGFYVGENLSLAIAWAKGKHKDPSVLEFDIVNSKYAQLNLKQLSHRQILNDWKQIKALNQRNSFKYNFDVVFGPLATNPYAVQYKFESVPAGVLLNQSKIDRIL
ncbi:MAG TPA: DUF3990 domain-containing protein [Saprospiraceae bacterium]|nr:DUF3990 domain-containing protein [Saprospiraceae bacterium]